jgi:hypothetical protein
MGPSPMGRLARLRGGDVCARERRATPIAGVAVLGFSLLLPMVVSGVVARPAPRVFAVATSGDVAAAAAVLAATREPEGIAEYEQALPDPKALRQTRLVLPEPAPELTPPRAPIPVAAVPIEITAVPAAPNGSVVTASWYGPGFFENRLPCWPWLLANGLPIQFLPDTWGVAHKSLPCGTMVTLTHGANTVTVPVVDRGPYIAGREFDLSPRVKAALGCTDLCTVVMHLR